MLSLLAVAKPHLLILRGNILDGTTLDRSPDLPEEEKFKNLTMLNAVPTARMKTTHGWTQVFPSQKGCSDDMPQPHHVYKWYFLTSTRNGFLS